MLTIGTGGVALFALQFAKLSGARVIALTSTETKAARLRQLGANDVINYRDTPEWDGTVRALTAGKGVEHVIETGGLDTLPKSIAGTREDGVVSIVAALGPGTIEARVFGNPVNVRRIYVGSRGQFETMNQAITAHTLQPVIDRVFSFVEARQAYAYFQDRKHVGKVIIAGDP